MRAWTREGVELPAMTHDQLVLRPGTKLVILARDWWTTHTPKALSQ